MGPTRATPVTMDMWRTVTSLSTSAAWKRDPVLGILIGAGVGKVGIRAYTQPGPSALKWPRLQRSI